MKIDWAAWRDNMSDFYARKIAPNGSVYRVEHAGFKAVLQRAKKLQDVGRAHGLPTGVEIPVFPLAALPGAPESWVREAGSYVCPVDSDWGLWFDFTMNDGLNTAVVPSVKGMNPITGQKLEGLGLESYENQCPLHKEPFAHGTFCEKCGYNWPPQNFISAPNTLWWDGFRQPDGKVRQFFFSADEARDIASLVIGKENTVPAFGFGFFRPKNPRMAPQRMSRGMHTNSSPVYSLMASDGLDGIMMDTCASEPTYGTSVTKSYSNCTVTAKSGGIGGSCAGGSKGARRVMMSAAPMRAKASVAPVKSVAVGAGAEISQNLQRDSLGLEGWQTEAAATIRLYFCFKEQFESIVNNGGVKVFESEPAGYMKGLPVG
jgi:hypothetical protein